jgi:dimethylargininase
MPELVALTRAVSRSLGRCELTHLPRAPIDAARAAAQHAAYERLLTSLGCRVRRLPAAHDLPDAVFVEDTAVVFDEVAIVTRPGAASRRAETAAVAEALAGYRPIARIEPPGTVDGGDVLVSGRQVFVGRSTRSNRAAFEQMRRILEPLGYSLTSVDVHGCLHLKSAATPVADRVVLLNPACVAADSFQGFEAVEVDPAEPAGANVLRVGDHLVSADAFPATCDRLRRLGFRVRTLDLSELAKAEGAVTCSSLVFRREARP